MKRENNNLTTELVSEEVICDLDKSSFGDVFMNKLIEMGLREKGREEVKMRQTDNCLKKLKKEHRNGVVAGGDFG